MKRILHIANARMGSGGVESFLMNLYRNIDHEKIQMDFIVFSEEIGMHEAEIAKMGGRIYKVPRKQDGLLKNINTIRKIVKDHHYQIVHRHCDSAIMLLDILAARIGGAKHIIAHSHSTNNEHSLIHKLCKPFLGRMVKHRFACSNAAGKWMFGNTTFTVIHNGIDCEKYKFNANTRKEKRIQLDIPEDTIVYSNISVFKKEKNLKFLINIFNEVHKQNHNSVLLLIGDGELRSELESIVKNLTLEKAVLFLGQRTDVSDLFQMIDIFVLPSLYEGLPLTMVEAQTSGVFCYISNMVPREAILNSKIVKQLPLEKGTDYWAKQLLDVPPIPERDIAVNTIKKAGYDIKNTTSWLESFYLSLE